MNVERAIVREKAADTGLINKLNTENFFVIQLSNGMNLVAREKRNRPLNSLFSSNEPFTLRLGFSDQMGNYRDFLSLRHPRKTFLGGNTLKVMDERKNLIGSISKKFSLTSRKFVINDTSNNGMFIIKSGKTLGKNYFEIFNSRLNKKQSIGEIRREWNESWWNGQSGSNWQGLGFQQGVQPQNQDTYAVQFPLNASAMEKSLILCSTFLIDFVFFDQAK